MLVSRLLFHPVKQTIPIRFQVISLFSSHRLSVLSSEYHKSGPTQFKMSRNIQKQLGNNLSVIQRIQTQLDNRRKTLLELQNQPVAKTKISESDMEAYLNAHSEFVKTIQKCQLNNQWIFKTIGWYNMTSLYLLLFSRLLEAGSSEVKLLVDAMFMMKYNETSSKIRIQDEVDSKHLERLYKNLPDNLELDQLQKIEKIFNLSVNYHKKKYYAHYIPANIEEVLRRARGEDSTSISDVIWLFHTSSIAMLDNEVISAKIEKCLMMINGELKKEDMEKLIEIYTRQGQIEKNFYEGIMKPYLVKNYMNDIDSLVKCIKFIVCSECKDDKFLQDIFRRIQIVYVPNMQISESTCQTLHIFKHYLSLKKTNYFLPNRLHIHLLQSCQSAAKTKPSVNNLVLKDQQQRSKHSGIKKATHNHATNCLTGRCLIAQECDQLQRQQFIGLYEYKILSQIDFSSMKLYKNVHFCSIQMNHFLSRQNSTELINLEVEGINYILNSGRILRQKWIKDEILNHYGIRTTYMDLNALKHKGKMSEQEYLLQNRITSAKRQIAKKIDQHTQIINNIQAGLRRKHGANADLPPIASVSLTFPITSKDSPRRTHSIHAATASRAQLQLQSILGNSRINFKDVAGPQINRIIFARPPHVQIALQQTKPRFRSSLYFTIDAQGYHGLPQKMKKQEKYRPNMPIKHSPMLTRQSPWRIIHQPTPLPTVKIPEEPKEVKKQEWDRIIEKTSNQWALLKAKAMETRSNNFSTIVESNPQAVIQNRKKMEKTLRTLHKQVSSKVRTGKVERYSPWRSQELEEQLII